MKRIIALMIAMVMCLSACAELSLVTPVEELSSLEELSAACGCAMYHPPVMGVTDERFRTYMLGDCVIGEYRYELAGSCWMLRAAATTEDILGACFTDGTIETTLDCGIKLIESAELMYAEWFNIEGHYVLTAEGGYIPDFDTFSAAAEEMYNLTTPFLSARELIAFYEALSGFYADSYSMRAACEAEAFEDCVKLTIHWSNSAFETVQWVMTAQLYEDGLLSYSDCVMSLVTAENETVQYENGSGFFSISEDGALLWSGAEDEGCRKCVFVKYDLAM